jgi:hypothetical protein
MPLSGGIVLLAHCQSANEVSGPAKLARLTNMGYALTAAENLIFSFVADMRMVSDRHITGPLASFGL